MRRKRDTIKFAQDWTGDSVYWFTEGTLMKMENGHRYEACVSLNWLLNPDCKIRAPLMRRLDINSFQKGEICGRLCPDVDICDHKQMEAYGFL